MSRSKSSGRWLKEHFDDEYVARAQREGYRSRAVYKLKELDERDKLFSAGMSVVDLGAAPGGWSQYAVERVGDTGAVIASDLLKMDAIPGVTFVEGDFTESAILEEIMSHLDGKPVDIVISDMAPNMSGMGVVDQPRSIYLVELAFEMAREVLAPGGTLVAKLFQGEGFDGYMHELRQSFKQVHTRKPKASRARSREVYAVARGMKL